jgi:hypothetical protein
MHKGCFKSYQMKKRKSISNYFNSLPKKSIKLYRTSTMRKLSNRLKKRRRKDRKKEDSLSQDQGGDGGGVNFLKTRQFKKNSSKSRLKLKKT